MPSTPTARPERRIQGSSGCQSIATELRGAEVVDGQGRRPLSPTERRVVGLVARGRAYKQIAGLLHVSEKTVQRYVERAREKSAARSTPHLIAITLLSEVPTDTERLLESIFPTGEWD